MVGDRTEFGSGLQYPLSVEFWKHRFILLASHDIEYLPDWVVIHSQAEPCEFPSPTALTLEPIFLQLYTGQ